MAFGRGMHMCLGQHIARVEIDPKQKDPAPIVTLHLVAEEGEKEVKGAGYELYQLPFVEEALRLANRWVREYLWFYDSEKVERSPEAVRQLIETRKEEIGFGQATGSSRDWWIRFEEENRNKPEVILKLSDALKRRQSTVVEFFLAYVFSGVDNILANLRYLDFRRMREGENREFKMPPGVIAYALAPNIADPNERIDDLIKTLIEKLQAASASPEATDWWTERLSEWRDSNSALLLILSDLAEEGISVQELFDAACWADNDDLLALLPFANFLRVRMAVYATKMEAYGEEAPALRAIHNRIKAFQAGRHGVSSRPLDSNASLPEQTSVWIQALSTYPGEFHGEVCGFIRQEFVRSCAVEIQKLDAEGQKKLTEELAKSTMFLMSKEEFLAALRGETDQQRDTIVQ